MRKLVFGLILGLGISIVPTAAKASTVSDEAAFVAKINDLRASKGLPTLEVNANLVAKARAWSAEMAAAGKIWHSTLSAGITEDWKKLGENVGMGGSVDGLHKAFVASPGHYANLVDAAFGHIGVGIVMNGSTIYVSEVFMQMMPAKTAPVVTPPPTTPPTTRPPVTTTAAPKPPAPKPAAVKAPVAPKPTPTTTTAPAPPPPPDPPPAPDPAPEAAASPVEPMRAPSALLVSVLERLRSFDS